MGVVLPASAAVARVQAGRRGAGIAAPVLPVGEEGVPVTVWPEIRPTV